jgi:toxin secretion/phage lysis holin|nr:MAG TPA: holin [Caudoviricetes sp.]
MNVIIEAIRSLVPVRVEALWGTTTGAIGMVTTYLFGAWNSVLEALIFAMVIDYISGVLAAYVNPDMALDSHRGFQGICKKLMILLLVSLAHFMDNAMGQQLICVAVTWFFLGNEGLSILENAGKAGVPIPAKLKNTLKQLSEERERK